MKRATILMMLVALAAIVNSQRTITVPGGFARLHDFSEMPVPEKSAYMMGFYNGLMVSGFLGADTEKLRRLHECTKEMDTEQMSAIMDKYVKDNPEDWHQSLAPHTFNALVHPCEGLRKGLANGTSSNGS